MLRKILLIEDEPAMRLGVKHTLHNAGYKVAAYEDGASGLASLGNNNFDLIITDLRLPDTDGLQILEKVMALYPDIGIVIITAYPEVETAVSAIKQGAHDYLCKPFGNEELLMVVSRFFRSKDMFPKNVQMSKTIRNKTTNSDFICESPAMKKVMDLIAAVAATDVPVHIQGESGTGKELVANALYQLSNRKDKSFLKINCAAIPENLLESDLFGYERGAFTGAFQTQKGKLEAANGGTIFFDEIGDMPLSLQPKLLRVLEEQAVLRIGSAKPICIDVRMIFATGKDLEKMIDQGRFREDLFYRINVVPIELPPLRKRNEDIPHLISHFMDKYSRKYGKKDLKIPEDVYWRLLNYKYRGNVRELRNIVERAVLLTSGESIQEETLPTSIREESCSTVPSEEELSLDEGVKAYERQRVIRALKKTDGKKIKAAKRLGISRKVLWKKMKDLGIEQCEADR